jgi:hypothetical protein
MASQSPADNEENCIRTADTASDQAVLGVGISDKTPSL